MHVSKHSMWQFFCVYGVYGVGTKQGLSLLCVRFLRIEPEPNRINQIKLLGSWFWQEPIDSHFLGTELLWEWRKSVRFLPNCVSLSGAVPILNHAGTNWDWPRASMQRYPTGSKLVHIELGSVWIQVLMPKSTKTLALAHSKKVLIRRVKV